MKKMTRVICLLLALSCLVLMLPGLSLRANAYASAKPLPALTGKTAQDVANVALSQVGYAEASDGGSVYGAWWTEQRGGSTNFTRLGWCGMFAAWCAYHAGAGLNVAYNSSAAQPNSLMTWQFANGTGDRSFTMTPKPGDFIYFSTGSSAQHVAIVVEYNSATNKLTFVGGNQSNKVTKFTMLYNSTAKYGSQRIIGIARPNYGGSSGGGDVIVPTCSCEEAYAGTYLCITETDSLNIRAGHGTGYSVVGSIPPGATVSISKAQGIGETDWAHVEYNGVQGYCSMKYLRRIIEYTMDVFYDEQSGEITSARVEIFDQVSSDNLTLTLPEQFTADESGLSPIIDIIAKDGFLLHLEIPLAGDFSNVVPAIVDDGLAMPIEEYVYTAAGIQVDIEGSCQLQLLFEAPEHTHSYTAQVTTQPTCEGEGVRTYVCQCGDSYTEKLAALGHAYTSVVTAPTCTAQGYTTHTCHCGKSYRDTYTPATGHSYVKDMALEPDCETEGLILYTCACGDSYSEDTPALGHSYTSAVTAPTCTAQGYTTHTCHCGKSYRDTYTQPTGHSYESAVTTQPSCQAEGVRTFTCGCGAGYTEVIPVLDHSYTCKITAPTCTQQGYSSYTCVCGDAYIDHYVAATGHSFVSGVCSVCGEKDPNYVAPDPDVLSGISKAEDGNFYYYVDGEVATEFTGLADNAAGSWYILNGQVQTAYDGLITVDSTKYDIKAGMVSGYDGLKKLEGVWLYFDGGVNDVAYEGLIVKNGMECYVQDGEINFNKTDVVNDNGVLKYVKYGIFRNTFDGLVKGSDGVWRYVEDGVFTGTYEGLAKNAAGWWCIKNSLVDTTFTGLGRNHVGQWYVKWGQPQVSYTGTVTFDGVTYNIKNGLVEKT